MIIAVCNEKGGSGKTNISVNLAVRFGLNGGNDTLLIDADPQMSVGTFKAIRSKNNLPMSFNSVSILGESLMAEAQSLKDKYKTIIIDTAGRDNDEMRQALVICDLAIIPTIPSVVDTASFNKMPEIFRQAKLYNQKAKGVIVISKASPNPFLVDRISELKEYLTSQKDKNKSFTDITLLNSIIYEREAYKNAFAEGKGVSEFCKKDDKAYIDFENFYNEILSIV